MQTEHIDASLDKLQKATQEQLAAPSGSLSKAFSSTSSDEGTEMHSNPEAEKLPTKGFPVSATPQSSTRRHTFSFLAPEIDQVTSSGHSDHPVGSTTTPEDRKDRIHVRRRKATLKQQATIEVRCECQTECRCRNGRSPSYERALGPSPFKKWLSKYLDQRQKEMEEGKKLFSKGIDSPDGLEDGIAPSRATSNLITEESTAQDSSPLKRVDTIPELAESLPAHLQGEAGFAVGVGLTNGLQPVAEYFDAGGFTETLQAATKPSSDPILPGEQSMEKSTLLHDVGKTPKGKSVFEAKALENLDIVPERSASASGHLGSDGHKLFVSRMSSLAHDGYFARIKQLSLGFVSMFRDVISPEPPLAT
ncbi:MAG: hypothetical protein LQ338_007121, partial [Usnochroma carphineum]